MDRKADIQRVRGSVRHLELMVVPGILSGSELLSLFPPVEGRLKPGLERAVRVAAVDVVFHRGSPYTGAVVAGLGMDLRSCVAGTMAAVHRNGLPTRIGAVEVPGGRETIQKFYSEIAFPAESFARTVAFAVSQPDEQTSTKSCSGPPNRNFEPSAADPKHFAECLTRHQL